MPEDIITEVTRSSISAHETFIRELSGYLESSGVKLPMVVGIEKKPGELAGVEGIRFLANVCQMVDVFKEADHTEEEVEMLAAMPLRSEVAEGLRDLLDPWFEELEQLKPELEQDIQSRVDSAEKYPLEEITQEKTVFALMLLVQGKSEEVTMLPAGIRQQAEALQEIFTQTKAGLQDEQRWRKIGWRGMGWRDRWKNGVPFAVASIVLTVACALGLVFGASTAITTPIVKESWDKARGWLEKAPGIGNPLTEKARNERHKKYENKKTTIIDNKKWPQGVKAENLLTFFDPSSGYNEWLAIIEFCGPECLLDPAWAPGEGKAEILAFFGVDEAGYKYLQDNPDKIDEQIEETYHNMPWLIDLFKVKPTIINLEGQSDFELWMEKYSQSKIITRQLASLGAVNIDTNTNLFQTRRNQFTGQRLGYMNRGRGFGTSKGV